MTRLTSVILPTYNRAAFLPDAIAAIRAQAHPDWELIVVDDGSTDGTEAVVANLCRDIADRTRYVRQENQGAYGARNTGLRMARGDFIAFYDSDDVWLPHHVEDCAAALVANPDIDWLYGACQRVDFQTGHVIDDNAFYVDGRPRPFLQLNAQSRGSLRVIDDGRLVRCAITRGLYCGLQNSVIRKEVFARGHFAVGYRNEAEDQMFAIRAALAGHRFGYFDNVHVVYRVHDANSSASATDQSVSKRLDILLALARGYEDLLRDVVLGPGESRAVKQRLAREYFWHAGYAVLWQNGRQREALEMFRRGLRAWPWTPAYWKTYLLSLAKTQLHNTPPGT